MIHSNNCLYFQEGRKSNTSTDRSRNNPNDRARSSSSRSGRGLAQTRSAQFTKEMEEYAENAYPLPARENQEGTKPGYEEVSLDVTPYQRNRNELKPVEDVSDCSEILAQKVGSNAS